MTGISEEQKQALVNFWQARPHLASVGSSTAITPSVEALWKDLSLILNNCDGDKRTWREWLVFWKLWRKKIERKMTFQRKPLSHVDTILATYMFEPGGDHEKSKKDFITLEQRRKMVEFWKEYPDRQSIIRGNDLIRKRWQELAVILNNCDGKKKTWREWCRAWSDMKYRKRKKRMADNGTEETAEEVASRNISKAAEENIAEIMTQLPEEVPEAAADCKFEGMENDYMRRRLPSSFQQKSLMLDFWERNDYSTCSGTNTDVYIQLWEELTEVLNNDETDGPQKSRKEWCKVWSDFKCTMKRKLLKRQPDTDFEERFSRFLAKNDGEDWRDHFNKFKLQRPTPLKEDVESDDDPVPLDDISILNIDHLPQSELLSLREQRVRILDFWKQNPDYFINKPGLGRKFLKHRRKLWENLTDDINLTSGSQRTRQEWIAYWNAVLAKTRIKVEKNSKLSDFEAQLVNLLNKCEADSYHCRLRLAKEMKKNDEMADKTDANELFDRLDRDKYDRLREKRRLRRMKAYTPITLKMTSNEQKQKLLQFWENHHKHTGGVAVRKKKEIQNLWIQVTKLMDGCEGPQRTWKEWSSLWSTWKMAVRRKIFNTTRITGDFEKRMAEYIRKSELKTKKNYVPDADTTCDLDTQDPDSDWENIHEPKIEINTDSLRELNYDVLLHTGPELQVEFENGENSGASSSHGRNFVGTPNILEVDLALKQQSLRMHQRNLMVQEKIAVGREDLVQAVKSGVQVVIDMVNDSVKKMTDVPALPKKSEKVKENEFDLFAQHIAMQLQMLPSDICTETQEKISQLFQEKQETVELLEPEDVYIIQVMDDKWDSDIPWVEQDTIIDN